MAPKVQIRDELIGEAVARQGGYEAVEHSKKWEAIANGLGLPKVMAEQIKRRYEDMLRTSAELDEVEDEDEEFEVETILDSRTDEQGRVQYLVKWKFEDEGEEGGGDNPNNTTWEPREHLACPELLEKFEEERKRRKKQAVEGEAAEMTATAAASVEASAEASAETSAEASVEVSAEARAVALRRRRPTRRLAATRQPSPHASERVRRAPPRRREAAALSSRCCAQ
jgi:hypothetical protein